MASGRKRSKENDEKFAEVVNFNGYNPDGAAKRRARFMKSGLPLFTRNCKLCQTPIGIVETNLGKRFAIDLKAPVYAIVYEKSHAQDATVVVRTELAYVDHRSTCPYRAELKAATGEEKEEAALPVASGPEAVPGASGGYEYRSKAALFGPSPFSKLHQVAVEYANAMMRVRNPFRAVESHP